ncbi:MAG: hypothetical protein AAF620_00195 [Bacteroidota bacterium]
MIAGKIKFSVEEFDDKGLSEFDKAKDFIKLRLKENTEYTIYLCDHKKNRSLQANRYYHGVVVRSIHQHTGIDAEDIHELLKYKFNPKRIDITGNQTQIGGSTRGLTSKEFILFIEKVRIWAMETLNLHIPLPQEVSDPSYQDLYIEAIHIKI